MARLKTVFLTCLVIISVILSVLLISGRPGPSPQVHREDVWFGPTPALHETSLPGRMYIINYQKEAYLVQTFSRMYSDLIMAFAQTQYGDDGGDLWTPGEYPESFPPGVLLRYDYQITRGLLASWLTMFYETDFPFAAIDSIFFPLDRGPVQFIDTASREVWQLQASMTWDVVERALSEPRDILDYTWTEMKSGENYSVAPGIFQLADSEVMVVPGWVAEEISYDAVIRSFYLEPSLIQELDGSEIYTDGLQALRIFPSGALEYTIGRAQTGSSVPSQAGSLDTVLNFICSHGGWPGDMLPSFIGVTSSERVRLEFSVFGFGLPITGDAGIAVELGGASVNYLTRKIITVSSDRDVEYVEIKPLSTHLTASESQAAQHFAKTDGEITDLALAYYFHQDQVIPVWRVWVDNQIISVGAADGRIINLRSLSGGD